MVFGKTLRESDLKTMTLPAKSMKHLPQFRGRHKVDLDVRDMQGREWHFGYSIRKKGHPKPVLSSGWREFVRYKHITLGDKVIFNLDPEFNVAAAQRYTIGVRRRIRLFGQEVWTDVF